MRPSDTVQQQEWGRRVRSLLGLGGLFPLGASSRGDRGRVRVPPARLPVTQFLLGAEPVNSDFGVIQCDTW